MMIYCWGIIIIVILFEVINRLYKKTNAYYNSRIDGKQFIEGMPNQLDLVYTGSTYSKFAFGGYEELNLNWGDFSIQAQSLEMDRAILKRYIDCVVPNGVVVVVVAAACLLLYRELGINPLYSSILEKKENPIYSFKMGIKARYPLIFKPLQIVKIIKDESRLADVYDYFPTNISKEKSDEELLHLINLWSELFNIENFDNPTFSDENIEIMNQNVIYLNDMLSMCLERGKRPVIVVPPFSAKMNQFFSEEFKEQVINRNIRKAIDNKNIMFFNYQDDQYFQNKPELFIDGGFRLNKYGSKIFINRFINDMEEKGIVINRKRNANENIK